MPRSSATYIDRRFGSALVNGSVRVDLKGQDTMVSRRPSPVIVFAGLGISLFLTFIGSVRAHGSGATPKARPAGKSRAHPIPRAEYPDATYGLAASYYSVRGDLVAQLIINNKGTRQMNPHVTLYGRDGRRHSFNNVVVGPRTFVDLDLRNMVAEAGAGFEDGSVRVSYTGQTMEMGGQIRMTDLARGIGFDEMLAYPNRALSNRLEGVWWLPDQGTNARLVVTNTTGATVETRVKFDDAPDRTELLHLGPWQLQVLDFGQHQGSRGPHGRAGGISVEYTGAPGAVLARGLIANLQTGYSAGVVFTDPAGSKTSSYHGTGVRVGRVEPTVLLEPVIAARNLGSEPTRVTGRLQITGRDGQISTIELPATTVGARQTRVIDARTAWEHAEVLATTVGIEFEYTTPPGSVILSAASVSTNRNHAFRIPLIDPTTEPSSSGSYYLQTDGASSAVAYIKNVTDQPKRFNFQINYAGGVWAGGLQTVAPHQTAIVDFVAIRDLATPDSKHRRIPADISAAQLHWSVVQGGDTIDLIGRAEQVDFAHGISSTAACPLPDGDYYHNAWLVWYPWDGNIAVGGEAYFEAQEEDCSPSDSSCEWPLEPFVINGLLLWGSTNSAVATPEQGYDGVYYGAGNGSAAIYGYGDSAGYSHEGEGEGAFSHVFLDLSASPVQVQWCLGEAAKSSLKQQYHARNIPWKPGCSDIRSGFSTSYSLVTWESLNRYEDTDVHEVGIVYDGMAAGADATMLDWDIYGNGYGNFRSGYRSPNVNSGLPGASPNSSHLRGEAVDIKVDGYLDSTHHGDGAEDHSSVAYATWFFLKTIASYRGASSIETWEVLAARNTQNHMHATWAR